MTQEDQDAVIGRLVREKGEAERYLVALQAEAQRLGEMFKSLGDLLIRQPQTVGFQNQPIDVSYVSMRGPLFKIEEIQGSRVLSLTEDIRKAMEKLTQLQQQASRLGI